MGRSRGRARDREKASRESARIRQARRRESLTPVQQQTERTATRQRMAQPAAKETTRKRLATPATKESTRKRMATPSAKESTRKRLATPAAKQSTRKRLATPAAKESTRKRMTTPAAKETTRKRLATPAARYMTLARKTESRRCQSTINVQLSLGSNEFALTAVQLCGEMRVAYAVPMAIMLSGHCLLLPRSYYTGKVIQHWIPGGDQETRHKFGYNGITGKQLRCQLTDNSVAAMQTVASVQQAVASTTTSRLHRLEQTLVTSSMLRQSPMDSYGLPAGSIIISAVHQMTVLTSSIISITAYRLRQKKVTVRLWVSHPLF